MAQVRVYAYAGLVSVPLAPGGVTRPTGDSLHVLNNPYLAGEVLEPSTGSAVHSVLATAPPKTRMLAVQIEPGKSIHYEITPASQVLREATTASPIIRGDTIVNFGENYRFSALESSV